ncbi:hypothetical protein, partial [Brasilonema octagenarum]
MFCQARFTILYFTPKLKRNFERIANGEETKSDIQGVGVSTAHSFFWRRYCLIYLVLKTPHRRRIRF